MIIFLDTEFTSLDSSGELISIALIDGNDKDLYIELNDFNVDKTNDWVKNNVLSKLEYRNIDTFKEHSENSAKYKCNKADALNIIKDWLQKYDEVQFWADVPHYDWVFFCDLFGGSLHLPGNVSFICLDLATLLNINGIDVNTSRIELIKKFQISNNYKLHNALDDAKIGSSILKELLYGRGKVL